MLISHIRTGGGAGLAAELVPGCLWAGLPHRQCARHLHQQQQPRHHQQRRRGRGGHQHQQRQRPADPGHSEHQQQLQREAEEEGDIPIVKTFYKAKKTHLKLYVSWI